MVRSGHVGFAKSGQAVDRVIALERPQLKRIIVMSAQGQAKLNGMTKPSKMGDIKLRSLFG